MKKELAIGAITLVSLSLVGCQQPKPVTTNDLSSSQTTGSQSQQDSVAASVSILPEAPATQAQQASVSILPATEEQTSETSQETKNTVKKAVKETTKATTTSESDSSSLND